LTAINARLISINGTVVWIQTSLGPAITDIRTINATVARIDGITATIQSLLGVMNGTITSIKNDIATIDLGPLGQIEADISSLKGTQETWTIPQYVTMIMALIAAGASMLSVMFFLRRRKTTEVR
jgi:hypothetical protein